MVSNGDNWIRIFDIPEISKHKKGFTIYKVISMLYPRNCPDSVTKVTVWKRYNDFKRFHSDVKECCKLLKINDKCPSLPKASYFRRFNEDVIHQRQTGILKFLEFVAAHPQLFSSDITLRFFKTSHTPKELLKSNINSIRADLNLPVDGDYNLTRSGSDDDHTISDTDSISTLSSTLDHLPDPLQQHTSNLKIRNKIDFANSSTSFHETTSLSTPNISMDGSPFEGQVFPTPPETPNSTSSINYVLEASEFITQAVELEIAKKYSEAFVAYKSGISVLLKHVKDDKDFDRKEVIRHKIEKYLLRAEKIYNLHLSPESQALQAYVTEEDTQSKTVIPQTMSELYKYKVVQIIASGMLVLHNESQQLYYIKVIQKAAKFSEDKLIIPKNVPYMVKLCNYYNCENALFLVLQYCSGMKLGDYIKQKQMNSDDIMSMSYYSSFATSPDKEDYYSDDDSDASYTDLISEYTTSRLITSDSATKISEAGGKDVIEEASDSNSKELISSINESFSKNLDIEEKMAKNQTTKTEISKSRQSSEMSEWSLYDDFQCLENMLLPIQEVVKWSAQLLLALEKLHLLGVICCDIQMKNLLIDDCGDLVLTFMCNVNDNKHNVAFTNIDDLTLAPELYSFYPITEAVDWWSFGAILYEMLVGMALKTAHPEGLTVYTMLKIPKYVSVEGRSLLKQLLAYEPHERLGHGVNGAEDVKSHPFFNSIVWSDLASKYKL